MIRLYSVVSLLDMLRFYADRVLWVANDLSVLQSSLKHGSGVRFDNRQFIERLSAIRKHVMELGLSVSTLAAGRILSVLSELEREGATRKVLSVWDRLRGVSRNFETPTDESFWPRLREAATVLNSSFRDELASLMAFVIPQKNAAYYAPPEPLFGIAVEQKLPATVSEDIAEAGKCFATARYTACAFHLMRVLETGVQKFGEVLGVTLIDSRGKEKNWQNILDEANREIGKLPQHDQRTKRLASISSNLYNVKLAWRNEVMHPKQTYTEEEALDVLSASRAFMRELASVLSQVV